jgi:hypothetical protein
MLGGLLVTVIHAVGTSSEVFTSVILRTCLTMYLEDHVRSESLDLAILGLSAGGYDIGATRASTFWAREKPVPLATSMMNVSFGKVVGRWESISLSVFQLILTFHPLHLLGMEFVGLLPVSTKKYTYTFHVVDYFFMLHQNVMGYTLLVPPISPPPPLQPQLTQPRTLHPYPSLAQHYTTRKWRLLACLKYIYIAMYHTTAPYSSPPISSCNEEGVRSTHRKVCIQCTSVNRGNRKREFT